MSSCGRALADEHYSAGLSAARALQPRHTLSRISEAAATEAEQGSPRARLFWEGSQAERCEHSARAADGSMGKAVPEVHSTSAASTSQSPHSHPGKRSPASEGCAATQRASRRRRGRHLLACGEALNIVRPLVYVAMLRRWGRRSWLPWLASLACDLVSRALTTRGLALLHEVRPTSHAFLRSHALMHVRDREVQVHTAAAFNVRPMRFCGCMLRISAHTRRRPYTGDLACRQRTQSARAQQPCSRTVAPPCCTTCLTSAAREPRDTRWGGVGCYFCGTSCAIRCIAHSCRALPSFLGGPVANA